MLTTAISASHQKYAQITGLCWSSREGRAGGMGTCGPRVASGLGGCRAELPQRAKGRAGERDCLWWGGEGDVEVDLVSRCLAIASPLAHTSLRADESSDFYFNLLNHLV